MAQSWTVIVFIAVGLGMDALAVAIATSVGLDGVTKRQIARLSWHFGFFQFAMPVLGFYAGLTVEPYVRSWDHWIAFCLLTFVGGKAVLEATKGGDEQRVLATDPTRGWSLVLLSVATSIDALAVGLSFAALGVRIWQPALIIGVVACAMTAMGMATGSWLGARFGRRMEILGGLVLIAIGIKIVVEHLGLL